MKRTLLISLLAIGKLTQAQNGYTAHTTNLNLTGTALKESALLVDNLGNKWIGFSTPIPSSNVGLIKYDGTSWSVYSTSTTPTLPSNYITALAKDNSNNIWIGTRAGLTKFDGTNMITYNTTNGLPSNTITCIETNGTQIYIGTNAGLSRFDGTTFTNYNVANAKLPNDTITAIKAENASTIWLGGNNRLINFNINGSFSATSYTNNFIPIGGGKVNCIYIDANTTKWLGTTTKGLVMYLSSTFSMATDNYEIYGSTIPIAVLDICEGINNGVALKMKDGLSNSAGILELAPDNKVYQYFATSTGTLAGDYIEKQGTQLIISQSGTAFTTTSPIIYYNFDKTNNEIPLTKVNSNNFKSLDINQVKAGIANLSDMHWFTNSNSGAAAYEVPKGSGKNSDFASALWISGLDNTSQLHGGVQTYRQSGTDFWPGPLNLTTALTDSLNAKSYDKIWKVSYTDINNFITNFNNGNVENGSYIPTEDILTWPANGAINYSQQLAPYVDINSNGIYDPLIGGDYPKIKGDQALYFIYNDHLTGATHQSGLSPMGIEVQAMAYAYGCPSSITGKPELSYTTFYDYKIINRTSISYNNVYVSMWSDIDLGGYNDDYIGCNVNGNYGYAYNADNFDITYNNYTPAQGIALLKGPINNNDAIDNDNDGIIDEIDEQVGMTKFTYFNNMSGPQGDPQNSSQTYQYMTGFWKDGSSFTCGANGYGGSIPTNWAYSGDPNGTVSTDPSNLCGNWTEISAANTSGDRRFILSSGPFYFSPGQIQEVEYAFVTSFDSTSTTNANLLSVAKLKTDIQKVKTFYNQTSIPNCLQAITIGINEVLTQNHISVFPNPANHTVYIKNNLAGEATIQYEIIDVLGKTITNNHTSNQEFSVNISDLKTGVYFIRLSINNNTILKKFIKE